MLALLNKARRYCAVQEQCDEAVRQKITAWGGDSRMAADVIERLHAEGYLDEARFARHYCESKLLGQRWGRQKVAYGLRMKRVSAEAVAEGMAAVDEEAYLGALEVLARKKWATLKGDDARRKLAVYLASRGYAMGEINQVINNIQHS